MAAEPPRPLGLGASPLEADLTQYAFTLASEATGVAILRSKVLQHVFVAGVVAALVAPISYYMGRGAAHFLNLPQITGYLVSGILCGPYVLGILSKESVLDLNVIEATCLAIIGLAAGAELELGQLAKSRKQVLAITLGICIASWGLCYAAFELMLPLFPGMFPGMDARHLLATSSLGATLMMARSPATAIAVMKEVEGKGPFCSLVMAVVVVKDMIVIMAYALNIELVRMAILPSAASKGLSLARLLLPALSVVLSMGVGVCGGLLLSNVLQQRSALLPNFGTELANHRARITVVLLLSTAVFQLAHHFDAEPLLACVTMGLVVANRHHARAEKEREEMTHTLHAMLQQIMSFTNVAFFGLAGASLKLSALKDMFGVALVLCLVRLAAIYLGSWVGCRATGTSAEVQRLFWMSMVTQAGIAIGLARLAGTRFPDWGPVFQTLMMSIILINLLAGPPLFRYALVQAGEGKGQGPLLLQDSGPIEPTPDHDGTAAAHHVHGMPISLESQEDLRAL